MATMALWRTPLVAGELRLDQAFQSALDEFRRRAEQVGPDDLPGAIGLVIGSS
jgi:hypothetical protein